MREWISTICEVVVTLCIVAVTYFLIGFMVATIDLAEKDCDNGSGRVELIK